MSVKYFVYRGVHAGHPAIQLARQGIVQAASPASETTAAEHNAEGLSELSPFTSWTYDKEVALRYARRHGPGGLLLQVPIGGPDPTERWNWDYSPDIWGEREVLMRGVRLGIEVISL